MAAERRYDRKKSQELIRYTAIALKDGKVRFMDLTGKVVDKSRNGICFITRYPLRSGYVVEFKKQILESSHGVVMWIKKFGGFYLAGTRLIRKGGSK